MANIRRLDILRVRNLSEVQIRPADRVNIIYGKNGSGKTSLLEAIHLLGLGRSFRSAKLEPVIDTNANDCVIFSELEEGVSIGLNRTRRDGQTLKLMGERQRSWIETARYLPLQIINSDSFSLLEGSPKIRRRFLDWGVFHVEHEFALAWRKVSKCLSQRNLLLKQRRLDVEQLQAWDQELAQQGQHIDEYRKRYVALFLPALEQVLPGLISLPELRIRYERGWDESLSLADALLQQRERDQRYGATQNGPHRADLQIRIGRNAAHEVLSRGQQKLLVSAMKIAQSQLLHRVSGNKSVYLIDDLPSELDMENRSRICQLLEELGCQIFITCVDAEELENCWSKELRAGKFHVEHGKITPLC
ncbi:MAG: DNA replication/repair protein RecF [Pseudomonadales bacterium]|nr:DNA replication/repair protein RecF [Pseudomonadales bacterium]MCP5330182.1 DNA replication/repair protein RecF [Pseudomonadales bacterium]MCP5344435.1 DNA replication/repair protein RecF [Pseudomonadales bacterium]